MGKGLNISTGILAILSLAPWAVYLGGLGKLTNELTGFHFSQASKQVIIMLEWYVLGAQLINLLIIAITAFSGRLHRVHSLLNMFLAVNTALLILRATERITQINIIQDDASSSGILLGLPTNFTDSSDSTDIFDSIKIPGSSGPWDPLPFLRALACGQVASATMNFFLAILLSLAGTRADTDPKVQAATAKAVSA
ncbi:hypothetical protein Agub_g3532 [Astrephomene gubernaculifera]|uniref:Uncharacterized protein n=1 Tax=Astrephomene gubernaculifera TaxID=47775 RepID=A0AAD3DML3_9CHLO|nr:hypothetical protein Agub_g3532 [Astrephomene gubernaculifera]